WAIDAAGNADYCESYIIVQDNLGSCSGGNPVALAGALKTAGQEGIEEASVYVEGSSPWTPNFSAVDMSNTDGEYNFLQNIPFGSNFTITPKRDDNPLNGVTTYDLVLISKHILGLEPLNSPYKMIAADANRSGSITTFDVVEIRKLILGIYQELPNNDSWRFVDKSFVFPNVNNPFQTSFPEQIVVDTFLSNLWGQDFIGVKVGDVNLSAVPNLLSPAEERNQGVAILDLSLTPGPSPEGEGSVDRSVAAGEELEVTFTAAQELQGFQFTLLQDGLKTIGVKETEGVTTANFGTIFEGATTVSVDGAQSFTLRMRAEKAGKLSEMLGVSGAITRAEAYGDEGRLNVALRFKSQEGATVSGVGFELYQNQPNPFKTKTTIGFYLPSAAEATLSIVDESGRVVYRQKSWFAAGENQVLLDASLLQQGAGVLYYTLETEHNSATRKMVKVNE
ncbi:MAG: T9SS type A sorting domain-containing protein, partial [Saprospiraceae bacterium]|nr:T9SS type A sorting domain-containing protein [Saprospiraceae bacterium]